MPQQRALEITADALNKVGIPAGNLRRSVQLEIRDNCGDLREAARQAAELTRSGVQALVGGTLAGPRRPWPRRPRRSRRRSSR
ncbi:hypothetical protein [Micromonospora sp. MH33]|uniref:hypothetical protein n=1 Tax=Micromonospora sp. MH33 TaxID=1945509 RepID=UPI0011B28ED8|nr:hypothetical protein [Micromonospora sp. MH33]